MTKFYRSNNRSIDPSLLKYKIESYYSKYRGYDQHDSGEFISSFLSILNDELKKLDNYKTDSFGDEEIEYYFKQNKTIITQLFLTLTCSKINNDIQDIEPNYIINLPIMDSRGRAFKSINECLSEFQKTKEIKGNFHGTSSTKILLTSDYLILNLNRVRKGNHYSNFIQYPEILNLQNYSMNINEKSTTYELISLIKHVGDEKFGHKIAYCKDKEDIWHEYNDSQHAYLESFPGYENLAFLFIYKRFDMNYSKTMKPKTNIKNLIKSKKEELIKDEEEDEENEESEKDKEINDSQKIKELIKNSKLNYDEIKKNNKNQKNDKLLNFNKLYEQIYSSFKLEKNKDLFKFIDLNSNEGIDENGYISFDKIINFLNSQEINLKEININLFQLFYNYEEYVEYMKINKLSKETIKKVFKQLKKKLDEKNFKKMKEFNDYEQYNVTKLENFLKSKKFKIKEKLSLALKKEIKNPISLKRYYDLIDNYSK